MQINYDNNDENMKRLYHDCQFFDKVMLTNKASYIYEIPYKLLYEIIKCGPMVKSYQKWAQQWID